MVPTDFKNMFGSYAISVFSSSVFAGSWNENDTSFIYSVCTNSVSICCQVEVWSSQKILFAGNVVYQSQLDAVRVKHFCWSCSMLYVSSLKRMCIGLHRMELGNLDHRDCQGLFYQHYSISENINFLLDLFCCYLLLFSRAMQNVTRLSHVQSHVTKMHKIPRTKKSLR